MVKPYTASEIEKKVLDFINKKTSKGWVINFNPLDVSKEGISDLLNLTIEEVEEAIDSLSGNSAMTNQLKRIESIKPKFEIWLPDTRGGQEIKDELCESGLAIRGNLNMLYSFLIVVLVYILTFQVKFFKEFLTIKNPESYFFWAFITTAVSIPLGNYFSHKWYQVNLLFQRVNGIRYYVYALIILITLILISFNYGWNIAIIIASIASIIEIISVVYQMVKDNEKANKSKKYFD